MKQQTSFQKEEGISLGRAALVAGLGLLLMVLTVPFAEFQIFPKLVNYKDSEATMVKLLGNYNLFNTGVFLNVITILCDVVVAWALYIFLKPANKSLSLLTAWFRLIYTAVYLMALMNLIKVVNLLKANEYFSSAGTGEISDLLLFHIRSFGNEWEFGLIIFGLYLMLLGFLVLQASYVPKIMGWLLIIAGVGYFVSQLGVFLFPTVNTDFLMITFFGELIFMVWLLVKGTRVRIGV